MEKQTCCFFDVDYFDSLLERCSFDEADAYLSPFVSFFSPTEKELLASLSSFSSSATAPRIPVQLDENLLKALILVRASRLCYALWKGNEREESEASASIHALRKLFHAAAVQSGGLSPETKWHSYSERLLGCLSIRRDTANREAWFKNANLPTAPQRSAASSSSASSEPAPFSAFKREIKRNLQKSSQFMALTSLETEPSSLSSAVPFSPPPTSLLSSIVSSYYKNASQASAAAAPSFPAPPAPPAPPGSSFKPSGHFSSLSFGPGPNPSAPASSSAASSPPPNYSKSYSNGSLAFASQAMVIQQHQQQQHSTKRKDMAVSSTPSSAQSPPPALASSSDSVSPSSSDPPSKRSRLEITPSSSCSSLADAMLERPVTAACIATLPERESSTSSVIACIAPANRSFFVANDLGSIFSFKETSPVPMLQPPAYSDLPDDIVKSILRLCHSASDTHKYVLDASMGSTPAVLNLDFPPSFPSNRLHIALYRHKSSDLMICGSKGQIILHCPKGFQQNVGAGQSSPPAALNSNTNNSILTIPTSSPGTFVSAIDMYPNNANLLVLGTDNGSIEVVNVKTRTSVPFYIPSPSRVSCPVCSIAFSGPTLLIAGFSDGSLRRFDFPHPSVFLDAAAPAQELNTGRSIITSSSSKDGNQVGPNPKLFFIDNDRMLAASDSGLVLLDTINGKIVSSVGRLPRGTRISATCILPPSFRRFPSTILSIAPILQPASSAASAAASSSSSGSVSMALSIEEQLAAAAPPLTIRSGDEICLLHKKTGTIVSAAIVSSRSITSPMGLDLVLEKIPEAECAAVLKLSAAELASELIVWVRSCPQSTNIKLPQELAKEKEKEDFAKAAAAKASPLAHLIGPAAASRSREGHIVVAFLETEDQSQQALPSLLLATIQDMTISPGLLRRMDRNMCGPSTLERGETITCASAFPSSDGRSVLAGTSKGRTWILFLHEENLGSTK